MTATHPTDRELSDFLLGKLADSHFGEVESHLADCPECGERALAAPADDTLTELLAAARTRLDSERASAPTPTLDATATPSLAAPTLTWGGSAPGPDGQTEAPAVLANHPKYRVVRRLGTGGMGTVWLAEHQVMHRPVAVKVIRPDLLARPGATGRFLREVRAAAKLHHPNIVTAFDAEPAGDSCLLVMEYVPGQTLGERLEAGPLPVAEACRAVRDAARGLAHAHSHGLVHRDVKPHNLIRSADGTTKVLDFGLAGVGAGEVPAASGDGLTGAGMVVGTPDYIAPEQIADPHAADARADVYGLGCTLYHLLAGRPSLPAGTVAEKLAAQPTHQPDPIPDLPPGLAEVLAKMMAKRPEDRYQTADELIAALEPYSGPLAGRAEPTRPARRRWYRRGLAIAAGILFGVAVGVAFKIERDNQVVTVATNDDDIEVVMKRKGEVLRVIDKKTGQEWTIDTEKNEIAQADAPGGLTLALPDNNEIVLKRNGKDVFTVARLPKAGDDRQAKVEAATRAAEAWLKLLDAGEYGRAWDQGGARMHEARPREDAVREFQSMAQRNGKPLTRSVVRRQYVTAARGRTDGEHVVIQYRTDYERATGGEEFMTVALEPDGRWRVASYGAQFTGRGGPGLAAPAPKLRQTIEEERRFPQTPAFTPDGKALLVAGFDYFAMYDPATGKELFSDKYQSATVNTLLAVSADGRTAAVACGNVFLYDLAARKRAVTIDMEIKKFVQITALTLSPDGQTLAYVAGREIVYYDRATGQTEYTRPDDDKVRVIAVRYTPDGRYLVVESQIESDKKSPVILQDAKTRVSVLDAKTRALVGRHELPGLWGQARLSGDGGRVFIGGPVAGKPGFVVLKLPECEEIERDVDLPAGMPIPSPDGRLLALTGRDGDVQVWDRGQKRVTFAWNPHPNLPPEFKPAPGRKAAPPRTGIAFSPDGRTLATARGDEIKVWELAPAAPKTDLDHLQGTWLAVSGEHAGKPWDAAAAKTTRLVFDGEVFHFTFPFPKDLFNPKGGDRPETTSGTFTLDPTKKPGVITLIGEEGDGVLVQGIYRLEGEQLTLCLGKPGHDRPRDFKSQAGGENTLLVLRRATDPAPNRGTERPDSKLILGTWRGVAAEVGGQPLPKEFIDTVKPTLTFTADKAVGKPEGTFPKPLLALATAQGLLPKEAAAVLEKGVEGVYRLDSTKSPKTIDITWLGEVKKAGLGIYQLDGDTLKLCLSIDPAQVDQRPTEFATKAGEMRVLLTLRRLTPEEVILEDVERRIDPAKGDGKSLPVALLEHRGVAALRFGKWRLVFEGVPCDARGRVVFGIRFFHLPEAGGEPVVGPPGLEMPAPALRQQWDGRRNTIALDKYRFVMEGKGKRLVFGDKAYEATDHVQTVVIARDGTTRLEPPAAKK